MEDKTERRKKIQSDRIFQKHMMGSIASEHPALIGHLNSKKAQEEKKLSTLNLTHEERGYHIGRYEAYRALVEEFESCKNEYSEK
jgi:hypothetical protein